jgi:uncharacterized protein (DUF427 family)
MKYTVKTRNAGERIAEGDTDAKTVREFEGNLYFTPEAVDMTHLKVTERIYTCPYKGVCYWIDLDNGTDKANNVGWVYRQPKAGYEFIKDQIGLYARDTAGTQLVKE